MTTVNVGKDNSKGSILCWPGSMVLVLKIVKKELSTILFPF